MNETDQDIAPQPSKRAQFPLWFLLFVIPTIAGLGFAIFANWQEQARTRADLIAHQAMLRDKIAMLKSEIALAQQVDRQVQAEADRWKSPDTVADYLKSFHQNEKFSEPGFYEIMFVHDINIFFLHADEADLHRLLNLLQEAFPKCDDSNKFAILDFVLSIPTHAPSYRDALAADVQRLADLVPEDAPAKLREHAESLRQAFQRNTVSPGEEVTK